ncbi:putative IS903 transposase domain protein [Escherichia coli 2-222-05_S3_C2]|nr:putative IS903 transposase domain protein [Escherichia coli 2-005-03_S1_C3]KDT17259.1 putative IS903 transposase domain protein [Escherichia coli 2-052-05_S1_C3]KDT32225.1 putative IS903 transposase domain protein [Escherichia coli 3-105-05_S3_C1]KDW22889.1 putative IS903 transposase domain protein [Escherichia coli 2-177-06_S1_C1]KDW34476.1 putative IS903 transposase domain protein [Escherichia coli 2-177-06_S1_C2]KDX79821.1 putative IS903 transposase domain protein [Escherichia coli 2-222
MAETAMFRIKTLLGGHLSLRDYDAQVGTRRWAKRWRWLKR